MYSNNFLVLICKGLPVLTVQGDAFPSRVIASLYSSFGSPGITLLHILVCESVKAFEDTAIRLLSTPLSSSKRLSSLQIIQKQILTFVENNTGIFDFQSAVRGFIRGMMVLKELDYLATEKKVIQQRYHHLVVTPT